MAKDYSRTQRLGEQIKRDLAQMLQFQVKDPRLGLVTLNAVKVASDLGYADIYFTVMKPGMVEADAETIKETEAVLNDMSGFLRTELSQIMKTRVTPLPRFHYDVSVGRGHKLTNLINQAMREDQGRNSDEEQ
ncbi:MAG: ribosome-binding factor A [Bermanella sp.]|nr:ribosome-binding factor A [Bermanella sp.]|tara:strand:- start:4531 stop:4929 length:399 start_codon:yes stop_codon:yes gene_type:complete